MASKTVSTRMMVTSDTHEHELDGRNMPEVDVLIHTGDLTHSQDLVRLQKSVKADLKLEIAHEGGHKAALYIMTGVLARDAGVTNPEEGVSHFQLIGFIATNPIPGTGKDLVITHVPPHSILESNFGCCNLLRAVSRTRPPMHCFGHVHESYGSKLVTWNPDGSVKEPEKATRLETEEVDEYSYPYEWPIKRGQQPLMVNAALVMDTSKGSKLNNKPFVVTLDLPYQ
ncbi:ser/Thr protein phosphatase family protein-like protein [Calycina marina]|uniref:Ser/Thr protein phosphatase family protein-like protein n=1 Tax=Calycina marina TaxID=1763456 RepID=A0A9P8CG77_9HELO|nr:ser/Thr protein phosphatase family protein-like protein [Calycina marina]